MVGSDRPAVHAGRDAAVSVVIPCHSLHRWPQLVAAVDSVRAQSPGPAEIVVAVDHNDDLLERARRELPGVTVLANRYTAGASGNRNTGVTATRTPLVALLDDDARARPGWLAALIAPLWDDSVIGTGGAIEPVWERERPAWFPDEFLWTIVSTAVLPPTPAAIRNVWSASMALRRSGFDAVGGFRTEFGKHGSRPRPEDTDLCLRMSRSTGGRWMYVPGSVVDHCVPEARTTLRYVAGRCYHEGRGKIELARLAGAGDLMIERDYLRRVLPRAVLCGLGLALRGRGAVHAARAGVLTVGAAAAIAGGLLEVGYGGFARLRRLSRVATGAEGNRLPLGLDAARPGPLPRVGGPPEGILSGGRGPGTGTAATGLAGAGSARAVTVDHPGDLT
jgi:GT2 family glycosyltransferase